MVVWESSPSRSCARHGLGLSINMKEVKGLVLSDGVTYTGMIESNENGDVPHGIGICKYKDHSEAGRFMYGKLNGVSYIHYNNKGYEVGCFREGYINGWGLKVSKSELEFGIFENSILRVNLSPLIMIFWDKIIEDSDMIGRSPFHLLKNGNILVGVLEQYIQGRFGFNFLSNGEVYLGMSDMDQTEITGSFLRFDLDYNITKGVFKDKKLIKELNDEDFISENNVWVNHKYLDFNINMNYNPNNFLFGHKIALGITAVGKTPNNLVVKANIGHITGDVFECKTGIDKDSIWFMFPSNNEEIEDELLDIADAGYPWIPDFSEYCVEFYNDFQEANNTHQIVYKHITCYNENADYILDLFDETDLGENMNCSSPTEQNNCGNELMLIPNCLSKVDQLGEQWRRNGWYYEYPSLRDYVESLAVGYDVENFFGWLFDDPMFNNMKPWNLPQIYKTSYLQFLKLFNN